MTHLIGQMEIESAIADLNQYVMSNMQSRSNPKLCLADLGEKDLREYQVPFINVKGEMQQRAEDLIAISRIVPGASIYSAHNSDKTVVTFYIRFPILFPVDAIPARYKTHRVARKGPPSMGTSLIMIVVGLAGLYWTYEMKSVFV